MIALAATLDEVAWFARGPGFVDTVTDSGMEQYEQYRQQAVAVLNEGKLVAASDPHYWVMRIKVEGHAIENLKAARCFRGSWRSISCTSAAAIHHFSPAARE